MFKIKTEVEYKIFDNAVKAIITPTELGDKLQLATAVYYNINAQTMPKITIPKNFVGTAIYKLGDVYDIEQAKIIARKKAMRALYSAYKNYCTYLYNSFSNNLSKFENGIAELSTKKLQMTTDIIKLTQ